MSVPGSSLLLRALQTQLGLELFMIQPQSTQNESKWILLIILDIQEGVQLMKSQEKSLEVNMLHRPHIHHYIVCYYINIAEHTV